MARKDVLPIERLIVTVRRQRVILSADLAAIYGVETRALTRRSNVTLTGFRRTSWFG